MSWPWNAPWSPDITGLIALTPFSFTPASSQKAYSTVIVVVITTSTNIKLSRNHLRLPRISSSPGEARCRSFGKSNFFMLLHEVDKSNHTISLGAWKDSHLHLLMCTSIYIYIYIYIYMHIYIHVCVCVSMQETQIGWVYVGPCQWRSRNPRWWIIFARVMEIQLENANKITSSCPVA